MKKPSQCLVDNKYLLSLINAAYSANTNIAVFGLNLQWLEPTIYLARTYDLPRLEPTIYLGSNLRSTSLDASYANHYTTNAILKLSTTITQFYFEVENIMKTTFQHFCMLLKTWIILSFSKYAETLTNWDVYCIHIFCLHNSFDIYHQYFNL